MPKHRILDILRRKSQIKKVKTQSETIEIGVEQVGYNLRVKSQLRQNMMAQKEIVENRLEFLSTQQIQLEKLVRNEQIKTKKISEKYNEFVEKFEIEKEIKQLDDILIQRKV